MKFDRGKRTNLDSSVCACSQIDIGFSNTSLETCGFAAKIENAKEHRVQYCRSSLQSVGKMNELTEN